ncbi:membrane protein [Streptococcus sobrinus DSM 20742 = ATCC 33478]|nr:membrane protein [Streptococcus sobrinus DSM 20742 = ATCC 33478]
MAAQRQDDFDYYNNQESQNQTNQNQPKYQEFYQVDNQSAKLRELLFFARIALFCISSVLLTFLFLTMGLGTLIAIPGSPARNRYYINHFNLRPFDEEKIIQCLNRANKRSSQT